MKSLRPYVAARSAFLGLFLGLLAGCGTPPQAGDATSQVAAATLKAGQAIEEASTDVVRLRRIHHIAEIMQKNSLPRRPDPFNEELDREDNPYRRFGDFACEGLAAYAQQRAGLAMLARFNVAVADLLAASPSTLGELMASIEEHRAQVDALKPADDANITALERDCAQTLAANLQRVLTDREGYVAGLDVLTVLPAAQAVLTSAEALWNVLQGILVISLQEVDQQLRAQRLKEFVEHPQTIDALQRSLGPCVVAMDQTAADTCLMVETEKAKEAQNLCELRRATSRERPAVGLGFAPLGDAALQCIIVERRLLAAIQPYFSYRALRQAVLVEIPKSPSAERSARLSDVLKTVPKIHDDLALFDRLRTARVPPNQHRDFVRSIVELRRIVRGDLTPAEKAKAIRAAAIRIAARVEALAKALGDAKRGSKEVIEKLRALEEALGS